MVDLGLTDCLTPLEKDHSLYDQLLKGKWDLNKNRGEKMKRNALILLITGTIIVFASAANAKTLRWGFASDALTMDPHSQNESPTINMLRQVYGTLVKRTVDLKIIPDLATSWEATTPTTWIFNLRKGVKFHDGSAFTAEDVKFSLERAAHKSSDYKPYVSTITDIEILNPHKIKITTKAPDPILPSYFTYVFIMDKQWSRKYGVTAPANFKASEESYAVRNTNGTGPFILVSREPDLKTVLKKNPNYYDGEVQIDKLVYTPIKEASTRVAALLSNEIDFLNDPPVQDLARLKASRGIKVISTPQIRTIFLGMDQSAKKLRSNPDLGKNPLADKRVREAMYRAIDAVAIQKKIMRGLSVPAGMITAPGVHGYDKKLDQRIPYSPKVAKKLLAEAGYPNGFRIRLDCPNDRYINDEAICQAAVSMLARIGIKASLNAQPKSIHFKSLSNSESDFYMLGWGVATLDSEYVFRYLVHTRLPKIGAWNHANYSNPEVDALILAIQKEVNTAKRDKMIATVWKTIGNDITYLPLHHQVINWAMSDRVNIPIQALNETYFYKATID